MSAPRIPTSVAVVAFFEARRIAQLLPPTQRERLLTLHTTGGIPPTWLAEALVARGIHTVLIGNVRDAEPMLLRSEHIDVGVYRGSGGLRFVLDGRRGERNAITAMLRELKPEVAHAMWTLEGGRAVADWPGPKLLTVHDAAWDYARLALSANPTSLAYAARWLSNTASTLRGFQHLIAVSPFVEQYLRRRHRFRGEIRVIPNAIPEVDVQVQSGLSKSLWPKSGRFTFACYGGPGRIKNIGNAIRAFRLLQAREQGIRLLIFGLGWTERAQRELGGNGVEFRGALTHGLFLSTLAGEVDVLVHPARIETHGITLCEALQCGCAVIAGRNSGAVAWTLDEGRSGLLVDVEQPAEIAEAMHALMNDEGRAKAMVAHGQASVRERFSPDSVLDQHLAYYGDILSYPR